MKPCVISEIGAAEHFALEWEGSWQETALIIMLVFYLNSKEYILLIISGKWASFKQTCVAMLSEEPRNVITFKTWICFTLQDNVAKTCKIQRPARKCELHNQPSTQSINGQTIQRLRAHAYLHITIIVIHLTSWRNFSSERTRYSTFEPVVYCTWDGPIEHPQWSPHRLQLLDSRNIED